MSSHTVQAEDPRDGTAAIPPVTEAMMEHAAHEAAALADGVAHGAAAPEPAAEAAPAQASVAEVDQRATEVPAEAADAAGEATRAAVETASAASEAARPVVDAVQEAARTAVDDAERVADAARDSASASADAFSQYNAKVLEIVRTNMAAASAHVTALVQAKSIPEAVSLNAEHLRRQIETLTGQGRDLATLAQQAAFEAFRPFRDAARRGR